MEIGTGFNSIFENLLDLCHKNDKEQQNKVEKKIKDNALTEKELDKMKMKYEERIWHMKLKLKAKGLEVKLYRDQTEMLEEEVKNLREIIKSEVMRAEIDQIKNKSGGN